MNELRWFLLAFICLLLLLIAVLLTKLKVHVYFFHGGDDDHFKIEFKAWLGLIKYKIDVPLIKVDTESPSIVIKEKVETGPNENTTQKGTKRLTPEKLFKSINDVKEVLNHVVNMHTIVRIFLKKVKVKNFEWHSQAGIGDAAHTGVLCGAIWTVKGSLIGLLSNYMKFEVSPTINVIPNFQQMTSKTSLKCMFQFRIGHAMLAGIKLIKYWKGGRPNFKSKPLAAIPGNKTKSV